MKVLILGGGGFLGRKLALSLADRQELRGSKIDQMVLADIVDPKPIDAPFEMEYQRCDISDPASVATCVDAEIDVIYLLAAVVSAHAEQDLDSGIQANIMGVLNVLERCRELETCPVVVFTSSIAVFGGDTPQPFNDYSLPNPQTSYGAQKMIGEYLITDYSRRGLIDGRGFRLPTITVRPGKPNRAASSFMSGIFREPLNGETANCPVEPDFKQLYLSPRKCVENLVKGAELDAVDLGQNRCLTMPGKTWTIAEMIEAMTQVAGPAAATRITWNKQPEIDGILKGWHMDIHPERGLALGLEADESFEDNIRIYLEDDAPKS
ncbi:MAG: D-erythronate dehydrogenase [Pelagimonas sp.]|uniref:D-erythronate dehydrogenase n=1 Tax=Pelagimonas sp. TaxID=2073170 RepID=UPI003D6A1350